MADDADVEQADEDAKSSDGAKMPIVIDLPAPALRAAKRFTLSDEQRRQLDHIQKLGMELGLRGKKFGIASACIGGGQGMAVLIERA